MEISFSKSKNCDAFKELMDDPTNRQSQKKFSKNYNETILKASVKIYQKLKSSPNALAYNQISPGNNKIEKASGVKKKNPVVLKVRIQSDYRKFFNFYETNTISGEEHFCKIENWSGFDKVCKIHVFDVNKHDYTVV